MKSKIFASSVLTFLLALVVVAQWETMTAAAQTPAITAYSVTNIQVSAVIVLDAYGVSSYTATVSTTKNPKTKNFTNGDLITISAVNCTHVPVKGGENGIVVVNGAATSLLFSDGGATCAVKNITLTSESSSKK